MSYRAVSVKKFRQETESIEDDSERILVQVAYLTAARVSELIIKTSPFDLLTGCSRPYGQFMKIELKDFEMSPLEDPSLKQRVKEKALVITMAVAKRGKRVKKQKADDKLPAVTEDDIRDALTKYGQKEMLQQWQKGEIEIDPRLIQALLGRLVFKAIALPVSTNYEPWTYDLLKYWQKHRTLTFDFTRYAFHRKYRAALRNILPPLSAHSLKNPLRHFRLSHLLEYYHFDAVQLSNYSGWTMQTAFGMQGMKASSNLDFYIHLAWRQYFRKLMRPIVQLM